MWKNRWRWRGYVVFGRTVDTGLGVETGRRTAMCSVAVSRHGRKAWPWRSLSLPDCDCDCDCVGCCCCCGCCWCWCHYYILLAANGRKAVRGQESVSYAALLKPTWLSADAVRCVALRCVALLRLRLRLRGRVSFRLSLSHAAIVARRASGEL